MSIYIYIYIYKIYTCGRPWVGDPCFGGRGGAGVFGTVLCKTALHEPSMRNIGLLGKWTLVDCTFARNLYTVWTFKHSQGAVSADSASFLRCLCCVRKFFSVRHFICYVLFSTEFSEGLCNPHTDTLEVIILSLSALRERSYL